MGDGDGARIDDRRPPAVGFADPEHIVAAVGVFAAMVGEHRDGLDAMNVFPVADGDTGSNLVATVTAAADSLDGPGSFGEVGEQVIAGALRGAQGNSGLLMCQYWIGFFEVLRNADRVDGVRLALAFEAAADAARRAVPEPVDGTFLTVADAVAAAALRRADDGASLADVLAAAGDDGMDALESTPSRLPVLAEHGVVDAGAAGLMLWVEALELALRGEGPGEWTPAPAPPIAEVLYEVLLHVDGERDDAAEVLRETWSTIATSVVVGSAAGHPPQVAAHCHTTDPGAAIESALALGVVSGIRVAVLPGGEWTAGIVNAVPPPR